MARTIDHRERKRTIRAAAPRLFAQHGYADVNFGMIAGECGLTRTLIYTYFKDKRAIFNEAVTEATSRVEEKYREIMRSHQSADAKLRQLCVSVIATLFDNRDFLCVIVDQLSEYRRRGRVPQRNIARHTFGIRRVIHSLVVEAIHRGEYARRVDANRATALVYAQFEADALRIAVTGNAEISECIDRAELVLAGFRASPADASRPA